MKHVNLKDENGRKLIDKNGMREGWKQHFERLFNVRGE